MASPRRLSNPQAFSDLLDSAPRVGIQLGAAADDAALDEVLQLTHDALIEYWPVRLGPVFWATYSAADAPRVTEQAGGEYATGEAGANLREFCRVNPGGYLVIAAVAVPDEELAGG